MITTTTNTERMYFYCNRSGKDYKSSFNRNNRKRKLKSQGYSKICMSCTNTITATKCLATNRCSVVFFKTRYGHSLQLQHIRLTQEDHATVAMKLASGVTPARILQSARSNIDAESLKRIDLLTREDVKNIRTSHHIDIYDGVRHENDVSMDLWVDEYKKTEDSKLMYKKQGEERPIFEKKDMILIFMNQSQQHIILKKFGQNIICIDSTHGLNSRDFELTTLMVVDVFGEAFPVACMFSNKKDTMVNEVFFEHIKLKIGSLASKIFMSDITLVSYNAWVKVMGPVDKQLFCSWHVDRAWKNNLSKISCIEKRKMVYKSLKVLQTELDETSFLLELEQNLEMLYEDPDTRTFGEYFSSNYCNNYEQWAYCFRKHFGINTNMRLESMHKVIIK